MKRCAIILTLMMCGAILFAAAPCFGRVLIVHSYHEQYDWVQGINDGLMSSFKSRVDYRIFYMDTKRRPDDAWKKTAGHRAIQVINAYDPQVIIAVDDNAQKFVASRYAGKSPIQVVFCGVNADPEKYGYPAENVTGILERTYTKQVLSMLKMMAPNAQNVAWVSDDSATAHGVLPRVRKMSESNLLPLKIGSYTLPTTFEQWQKSITSLEKNPDVQAFLIPVYHTVKSKSSDTSVLPSTVMRWTVEHTTKPVVGLWPFSTDDGALCTIAVDPYEHGKVAALMTKQILAGQRASAIPIVTNKNGYVIINLESAHRLKVDVPFELIQSADKIIE